MIIDRDLTLDAVDVRNVLKDIGRDNEAQEVVRIAQHGYFTTYYHHYLSDGSYPDDKLKVRLLRAEELAIRHGRVLAALDRGMVTNAQLTEEQRLAELLARREKDQSWFQFVVSGGSDIVLSITPVPGCVGEAVKLAVNAAFEAAPEPSLSAAETNSKDLLDNELERMLEETAQEIKTSVEYIAYDAGALTKLPRHFINPDTGEPLARSEWDDRLQERWEHHLANTDEGLLLRDHANSARERYQSGYSWITSLSGSN